MRIILELVNIKKAYKNKKQNRVEALRGVSFSFKENGMVFIVGKSGSGKSTLLNILGLLDIYDEGEYLINGKRSKDLSEQERDEFRAQKIGFIFQEFHIIEKYSIGQNISLPLEIQQDENSQERVKEILKKVRLDGYENRKPAEISGGQKQRIAIARAIIKDPQIILADEPTGSLDSVTGAEIFNILQELSKDRLVIIISHDIESAHKYGDQIIELKDGLVDKIYDGDGGAESVRFIVDTIKTEDLEKYNNILAEGKKVTLTKTKPPKIKETHISTNSPKLVNKGVKLPLKSSFRLSFFSMKSKWVRTFFTILISMFAVAFFGFTDIISSFRADDLYIQDLVDNDTKHVSVGVHKVQSEGLFDEFDEVPFGKPQTEAFKSLGLEAYEQRKLLTFPELNAKRYTRIFPERVGQFYYNNFNSYTEVDDLSILGVVLKEGRAPENVNEIVINSYHMAVYKMYGFDNEEISIDSVTEFSQIENQNITLSSSTYRKDVHLKIVGLMEIDLSAYEDISLISTRVSTVSKEQNLIIKRFLSHYNNINNIYVKNGFYEYLEDQMGLARIIRAQYAMQERNYTSSWSSLRKITKEIFSEGFSFREGIESIDDIKDNQIVLSTRIIERFFPDLDIETIEDAKFIFGEKLTLTSNVMDGGNTIFNITKELEVVGVYFAKNDLSFVSQNIADETKVNIVQKYKIPSFNEKNHREILNKISETEDINVEEEVYRFFVDTPNYNAIKTVDRYFVLFVNLFSVLAIVLFIFAIVLNYTFISQSIELRKKDIGILRSLGARKKDVASIFVVEGIFTAFLEIVLGTITCFLAFRVLDRYFVERLGEIAVIYNIIEFTLRQAMLMVLATIIAVSIALFVPIYRIANKQPVDAIRN